ncbi:transmembrane channel-like protein 7 [Tubulanus polymorphus]|uniref:transmembrane channel-like protein 7 n=1 Tax=Tubulanus polymorphus TaxID=672921 RepID=UPI003DA269FB
MSKVRPESNDTIMLIDISDLDDLHLSKNGIYIVETIARDMNLTQTWNKEKLIATLTKIRDAAIPIEAKRLLRYKLLEKISAEDSSLVGRGKKRFLTATKKVRNAPSISVWGGSFKSIEGHFGSGVLSYFVFLRWLFFLNLFIFLVVFLFAVIPQITFPTQSTSSLVSGDIAMNTSIQCSALYDEYVTNTTTQQADKLIQDFLQGTGWMERTILFYGYYDNQQFSLSSTFSYNMPLAYLCVAGVALLFSLILMVCSMTNTLKRNIVDSADQVNMKYSSMIFSSWDYTLTLEDSALIKAKSLYQQFSAELDEERRELKRIARTTQQKCNLYSIRLVINLIVIALLAAGGYCIYVVTTLTLELTKSAAYSGYHDFLKLLIEFLPSLTITALNAVLPTLFKIMVKPEEYRPMFAVQMTIVRAVLLRLASLGFLIATLYVQVTCSTKDATCSVGINECTPLRCWETYVGQNFYKLVIMDFLTVFCVTLIVEFPRKLIVDKCQCKIVQIAGYQEFDIPKNVLDLIYGQTLCWIGFFFCPLIPGMTVVKYFIVFYLKKGSALVNMKPSEQPFVASRSNTFFLIVLLLAYFLCALPIGFVIARIGPSKGCGPFRVYNTMYESVTTLISSWPAVVDDILNFLGSAGFIVPLILLLILMIYYYATLGRAFRARNDILKEQLILEGKDKQFMVARLNSLGDKQTSKKKSLRSIVSDASKGGPRAPPPVAQP